jgi:hypothetical protein
MLKKSSPRHIIIKLPLKSNMEKILKTAKDEHITYQEILIQASTDFSAETLQTREEWDDTFKELKKKLSKQEYVTWLSFQK